LVSPFKGAKYKKNLLNEYKPNDTVGESIWQIILSCLSYNPLTRPRLDCLIQKVKNLKDSSKVTKEICSGSNIQQDTRSTTQSTSKSLDHTQKYYKVNLSSITDISVLENKRKPLTPTYINLQEYQELNKSTYISNIRSR
jgi:hypothetical protein